MESTWNRNGKRAFCRQNELIPCTRNDTTLKIIHILGPKLLPQLTNRCGRSKAGPDIPLATLRKTYSDESWTSHTLLLARSNIAHMRCHSHSSFQSINQHHSHTHIIASVASSKQASPPQTTSTPTSHFNLHQVPTLTSNATINDLDSTPNSTHRLRAARYQAPTHPS